MMGKLQTLHSHTTTSDGELNYLELLDAANKNDVEVVAFTDHDALPSKEDFDLLINNYNHPTKWIIGIELTSDVPKELMPIRIDNFHIVGLFVDPFNDDLNRHCQLIQSNRVKGMQTIVERLQKFGFVITEDEVNHFTKGKSVAWPHIVAALTSKESNNNLIEKYRRQMEVDAQNNPELKQKYDLMMQQGEGQYPYSLFLRKDAYFSPPKGEGSWPDFDQIVSLIRNAGGLAVIAHYPSVRNEITLDKIDEILNANRIDGMETICSFWAYGTDEESDIVRTKNEIKKLLSIHNKVESGGIDAHKEEDFRKYKETTWYSQESIGLVQKILEKREVNLKWSSLELI